MFGNMEEMQEKMRAQLKEIKVEAEAGGGVIHIEANAAREILNIKIDPDFLKEAEAEELEDLLVVAMNNVIQTATAREAEQTQKLLKDMMPPGLGGLSNLFG